MYTLPLPTGGVLQMRRKSYRVQLSAEEEKQLKDIVGKGVHPAMYRRPGSGRRRTGRGK
jgi:hypothetical protein